MSRFSRLTLLFSLMAEAVILAGIALLFAIKWRLFEGLNYHGDLFLHTQIATGVYKGRTLFFDNVYAPASYIHNYLLLIPFGPLVLSIGAYGLFFVHGVFLLIASFTAFHTLRKYPTPMAPLIAILAVVAIFFGPISLWILDDPVYGWHTELLFFPLGILFLLSLVEDSQSKILIGALLVCNREDGAVLACSLHLLYEIYSWHQERTPPPLAKKIWRLSGIAFFWVVIFAIGMACLAIFADPATDRQGKAKRFLLRMMSDRSYQEATLIMLRDSAFLLSSLAPFYLIRTRIRYAFASLLSLLPTLVVCTLASFAYLPKIQSMLYHGTNWPSRFAMLWAVIAGGVLLALKDWMGKYSGKASERVFTWPLLAMLFAMGGSLFLQHYALKKVRGWDIVEVSKHAVTEEKYPITKLRPREKRFLSCLKERLPKHVTIAHTGPLGAYFVQHDWVFGINVRNAWKFPELFVCDEKGRLRAENGCLQALEETDRNVFREDTLAGLRYAVNKKRPLIDSIVSECRGRG